MNMKQNIIPTKTLSSVHVQQAKYVKVQAKKNHPIYSRVIPPLVPYTSKLLALESRIIMYRRDLISDGLSEGEKDVVKFDIMDIEDLIDKIIEDPLEYDLCEMEPWLPECKVFDL